jgi:hypothetical protein
MSILGPTVSLAPQPFAIFLFTSLSRSKVHFSYKCTTDE